jgi:hypothetical protein
MFCKLDSNKLRVLAIPSRIYYFAIFDDKFVTVFDRKPSLRAQFLEEKTQNLQLVNCPKSTLESPHVQSPNIFLEICDRLGQTETKQPVIKFWF